MGSSDSPLIVCRLGSILKNREITMAELSRETGITMANLSILKTGKAKAIRFKTLSILCEALDCDPGEILALDSAPARGSTSLPRSR